jgi:hypothetical protein
MSSFFTKALSSPKFQSIVRKSVPQGSSAFSNLARQVMTGDVDPSVIPLPPDYDGTVVVEKKGLGVSGVMSLLCFLVLVIGIIVLVASERTKCVEDPNGEQCKNSRIAGITLVVIGTLSFFLALYMYFK